MVAHFCHSQQLPDQGALRGMCIYTCIYALRAVQTRPSHRVPGVRGSWGLVVAIIRCDKRRAAAGTGAPGRKANKRPGCTGKKAER